MPRVWPRWRAAAHAVDQPSNHRLNAVRLNLQPVDTRETTGTGKARLCYDMHNCVTSRSQVGKAANLMDANKVEWVACADRSGSPPMFDLPRTSCLLGDCPPLSIHGIAVKHSGGSSRSRNQRRRVGTMHGQTQRPTFTALRIPATTARNRDCNIACIRSC